MSYRTFKKLMGETSLERKCRFLFGGGLMLLITGSFYFYAQLNTSLLQKQNASTARKFVAPTLARAHWNVGAKPVGKTTSQEPPKTFRDDPIRFFQTEADSDISFEGGVYRVDNPEERRKRLPDAPDYDVLKSIRNSPQGSEFTQVRANDDGSETFWYYRGVYASQSCTRCHNHAEAKPGELIGVARIGIPLQETNRELAQNNMILLALAIVTAFLAMLAAYLIVRYVIVKPVLHLKDVSDGIARGTLDLRADIRTGDEFEELSHAFNRMLRHLVTVQDELREVNSDLDGKVDELAQVNLQLYEMNKLKDEFLATMSHELRTPLNSILGFSEILAGAENLNERQKRYLNNIRLSGEDLMTRIGDVLDLAKIESGKMSVQPIEFSVADLVERQIGSLMPLAQKKNIDLSENVSEEITPVYQDYGKVQQILTNLLSNAIKFTPEGGRVRVAAGRCPGSEDDFLLIVEDTGIGTRLPEQETIFEKVRQGKLTPGQEDAMTREYGGTGLGLSIVKELSKLLGGEVSLESEFGKGSRFTVRLPIQLKVVRNEMTAMGSTSSWTTEPPLETTKPRTAGRETKASSAEVPDGEDVPKEADDKPIETAAPSDGGSA